ncbi:hypothetical protein HDU98_003266 [Podochytrium sp. JEL0797]|nr:hypothetical protein HDU98_003266 [Podochytrium sp. JEL0797]
MASFFSRTSAAATRTAAAARFELSSPTGLLKVTLPPTSRFLASPGAVVAVSDAVHSRLTTHTTLSETATRLATSPLTSPLYFTEFKTTHHTGTVLLGPPRGSSGEMAVVSVGAPLGREMVVKRRAVVAVEGEEVVVKAELNTDGLSAYRIYNSGSLAFSSPAGSIHSITLAPNQELLVDPDMLIAWDAAILVTQTIDVQNSPAAFEDAPRYVGGSEGDKVAAEWETRFRKWGNGVYRAVVYAGKWVVWKGRNANVVNRGMYRLKGPGECFLATRRQPSFSWLRQMQPAVFRVPK